MKKYFLLICLIIGLKSVAQIKAMTEDGKEVVLFDNKTWRFVNESDASSLETINTNNNVFIKDKNATFLLKSKKINAGLYYNAKIWKITDSYQSPYIEKALVNLNNDHIYGIISSENIEIASLKNLKDIQISSIERRVDFFRLKNSEYRNVNGIKILYLNYIANLKGIDFEYFSYFYLTNDGYMSLTCFTSAKYFEESKPQIETLMNGIVAVEKEKR